jgi:hypothetical protein
LLVNHYNASFPEFAYTTRASTCQANLYKLAALPMPMSKAHRHLSLQTALLNLFFIRPIICVCDLSRRQWHHQRGAIRVAGAVIFFFTRINQHENYGQTIF